MRLKDFCESFSRTHPTSLQLTAMAATEVLAQRLAALTDRAQVEGIPAESFDLIVLRIDAALATGMPLSRKDLRLAPWCIWSQERPLAEIPGRLEMLLDRIAAAGRRKVFRTLAGVYLQLFGPTRIGLSVVSAFLERNVKEMGSPWVEAQLTLRLFSAVAGPGVIAERALATGRTPEEIMALSNIQNPSSYVGFCQHTYQLGYARLEASGNTDPMRRLNIIKAWAFDGTRIRFDSLRVAAVRAAIDPFENALPEKSTRDAFLGFALSVLSDPRVTRSRWSNCAATEQTVRRWLTEQSLRQFFEVVDRVAPPGQWAYRHAFWNALYERGHIEEAWVVFEPTGADEAKRMYGGDISFARFGRSAGVARGHSVLLLKIGSLVVAEWSHNSSCSIWDEGQHEKGPSLYKSSYDRDALRKPIVGAPTGENLARQGVFYHNGSESYSWQKRIANYLRNRRNIELRSHEYRVPV